PAHAQPLPDEREHLAIAIAGAEAPAAVELWEALAEALAAPDRALVSATAPGMHPTRTAALAVAGQEIGWVGEVHPRVLAAFDISCGPGVATGARSLAYRLRLQATDRTLTDADIADARDRAIAAVTAATGASLRS